MEDDIIKYLIENSTFIKNNLMSKVDSGLSLMMIVFIILNEDDLAKKKKNCILLEKYVDNNASEEKTNNTQDFLNIISTINIFIGRVYGNDSQIIQVIDKLNSYRKYLINNEKIMNLRIS